MRTPASWVVVGLDNGGTSNNATVLDATGQFLVDRMVETKDGDVVVARLGCEFTVKRLHTEEDGRIQLVSENPSYEPIQITEGMDFEVWGRVMYSIHRH